MHSLVRHNKQKEYINTLIFSLHNIRLLCVKLKADDWWMEYLILNLKSSISHSQLDIWCPTLVSVPAETAALNETASAACRQTKRNIILNHLPLVGQTDL